MQQPTPLEILFGSRSRTAILTFLINNSEEQFQVNEIKRKTGVNARLVSSELKKLSKIEIIYPTTKGNLLLYRADSTSRLFKPLKEIFTQSDWFEWERPSRIHHLVLTLEAGLVPMKEYYGHCLPYAHLIFNYDNVTWFFKLSEFQSLGKKLLPFYKKHKKQIWRDFESFASTLWFHKDYKSFYKNYINFWKVAYIAEPVSFYIDSLLKPGEHISIEGKSFTEEYEQRIWELAKQAQKIGIEAINVKPIVNSYFWIRNSYHSIHRLTEEEVRTEARKKMGKKYIQPLKQKEPTSLSKDLLTIGKEMILMQDIRKKYMMKAAYYLHEHLKQVGKQYDLRPSLMAQTLPVEVLKIKTLMPALGEELLMREHSCTIIGDLKKGIKVTSGRIFFPEGVQRKSKLELKGRVACGGKAVGRAKIVKGIKETYKVNHGDIIISPMTTPDIMPAIRRCVAIATDFGGITCHAAIISREFNIPCVVGTNNASEIIKDNDLVEVDADNGVVKVLQSEN